MPPVEQKVEAEHEDGYDSEDWEEYLAKHEKELIWQKLKEISSELVKTAHFDILDNPDRWLYFKGPLSKKVRFGHVTRMTMLFNDLVLFAKETKGGKYLIKQVVDLQSLEVQDVTKGAKFSFMLVSPENKYVLAATTADEKQKWMTMVRKSIRDFKEKLETERQKIENPLDSAMSDIRRLLRHDQGELNETLQKVIRLLNDVKRTNPDLVNTKARLQNNLDVQISNQAPEVATWLKQQLMNADDGPEAPEEIDPKLVASTLKLAGNSAHSKKVRQSVQVAQFLALLNPHANAIKSPMARRVMAIADGVQMETWRDVRDFKSTGWDRKAQEKAQKRGVEAREWQKEHLETLTPWQQCEFMKHGFTARQVLKHYKSWNDFDPFRLDQCCMGRGTSVLALHLFEKYDLFNRLKLPRSTLCRFMRKIEDGYIDVPYHSRIHATDVLQNMSCFLQVASMTKMLAPHEMLAGLVAAAIHDYKHPGVSNNFLVAIEDDRAVQFNDISVLENFHCAEAFKTMMEPSHDILALLPPTQRREVRDLVIEMVLATDMRKHFELHQQLHDLVAHRKEEEEKLQEAEKEKEKTGVDTIAEDKVVDKKQLAKERRLVLQAAMHCADLANPAKPLKFYLNWTAKIMQEFFDQGDKERLRKLPISPMCDKLKPAIEKSQIGFISVIVSPLFATVTELVPEMKEVTLGHLKVNKTYWADKLKEKESAVDLTDDEEDSKSRNDEEDEGPK